MYGNVVGGLLTVGVGQHSIEVCVERERAAAVGTQEQMTLVWHSLWHGDCPRGLELDGVQTSYH